VAESVFRESETFLLTNSLPVVLLVGGAGSRMGADSGDLPKHLLEVGGRAMLWHVMRLYSHFGHTHFLFPLGQRGEAFRRYFLEFQALSSDLSFRLGSPDVRAPASAVEREWQVMLFDAGIRTRKGARVRLAAKRIDAATFCVTYGDGIGDVDINRLIAFHRSHGRLATLTGFRPLSQYGVLQIEDDGRVLQLDEKPRLQHWINAGFFVFERGVLEYLAGDESVDLETVALPRLAAAGELMMYRHEGFWASMDTFKDARYLNEVWDENAPWKVWGD